MSNGVYLIDPGLINSRLGMADADGEYAAEAVQITITFIVPDKITIAFDQSDRLFVIGRDGRK